MKNLIYFFFLAQQFICAVPANSQNNDMESLKTTYASWIKAWNDSDAVAVAEISWGNYGFGRDVPFLRKGTEDKAIYLENIRRYMDSMTKISYQEHFTDYRIIDGVGFVDGYYAQTTQQLNGPLRSVYGRQSLVFIKKNGNWRMVHYHRSALPNEFIR